MKSKQVFKKGFWTAFIIVSIELAIVFAFYLTIFDYETIKLQQYPHMEVLRFIHLGFFTNMESLFFPFWLMAAFIRFGLYIYLQLYFIHKLFHIDQTKHVIPALAFFITFVGLLPTSPQFTLFHMKTILFYIGSPILISFPFILWLVAWIKGEFKHG